MRFRGVKVQIGWSALALASLLFSCTNGKKAIFGQQTSGKVVGGSAPAAGGGMTLASAIASPSNPGEVDLIDAGDGSIGLYCTATGGSGSSGNLTGFYGPSTCTCNLSFTTASNGATQQAVVQTDYVESDMLRCNLEDSNGYMLPDDAENISISIQSSSSGGSTSAVAFSFSTGNLNTSSASLYYSVTRHQCRDLIKIQNFLDTADGASAVYDPNQSEDGTLSQPMNFYASNLAAGILAYSSYYGQHAQAVRWSCPDPVPSPSPSISPMPKHYLDATGRDTTARIDLRLFLQAASNVETSANGSQHTRQLMPPQAGFTDHQNFLLASQQIGAFSIPINAAMYPSAPGVIGYAAPVARGANTETCPPFPMSIPSGYSWMKLWLFRASLLPRHTYQSDSLRHYLGFVACQPDRWSDLNTDYGALDCTMQFDNNSSPYGLSNSGLLNRVLGIDNISGDSNLSDAEVSHGVCIQMGKSLSNYFGANIPAGTFPSPGGSTPVLYDTNGPAGATWAPLASPSPWPSYTALPAPKASGGVDEVALGTDIWVPDFLTRTSTPSSWTGSSNPPPDYCGGTKIYYNNNPVYDPLHLCDSNLNKAGSVALAPIGVAPDGTTTTDEIQPYDASSRYDYIFFVTSPSVMTSDMANYTFYRFYSPDECPINSSQATGEPSYVGEDPEWSYDKGKPSGSVLDPTCANSNRAIYGVKLYQSSDNNGDGTGETPVFPVCVLQKTGGGS